MIRLTFFKLFLALMVALALLAPTTADAAPPSSEKGPRCSDGIDNDGDGLIDGDDPDCGGDGGDGGDTGQSKIPSIVTFTSGDLLGSDATTHPMGAGSDVYEHGDPTTDDLRVFIGSQANTGNIFMQFGPDHLPQDPFAVRGLTADFSNPVTVPDADCPLPTGTEAGPGFIEPHFFNTDVESFTPNGLLGLENVGDHSFGSLGSRFFDNVTGDPYFLNVGPVGGNSPCKGQWDLVDVVRTQSEAEGDPVDEWTVTIHSNGGALACLEKAKNGPGTKAKFCGTYHLPASFTLRPCTAADNCPPAP